MIIAHAKIYLKQDADMLAVKEIVDGYKHAKLDDDNYIVYINTFPKSASDLIDELHSFTYSVSIKNESF